MVEKVAFLTEGNETNLSQTELSPLACSAIIYERKKIEPQGRKREEQGEVQGKRTEVASS